MKPKLYAPLRVYATNPIFFSDDDERGRACHSVMVLLLVFVIKLFSPPLVPRKLLYELLHCIILFKTKYLIGRKNNVS